MHEEKDSLNWPERFDKLKRIAATFKSQSLSNYDCIVPVSGGRDSHFIVHIVKNILGLRPLLAYYNSHYNTDIGTRNLAYLRIAFNCDMMGMHVSSETAKAITRATLDHLGSMYWHVIAGQTVWPVRLALQFKVPLIIWGAHQGVDQVGMFSHLDDVEMTRKYRKEHDLMGVEIEDLVAGAPELDAYNTAMYAYPHDGEIEKIGLRGIYLNNYLRWDSKSQHELMIRLFGYETAAQQRTFDCYNDVDSHHYSGIHDEIKFRKWGYGKVLDHACREIRLRRMSREQGLALVREYHNRPIHDLSLFLDWIDMPEQEFWPLIDRHRDKRIWQSDGRDGWELRHTTTNDPQNAAGLANARLAALEKWVDFHLTPCRKPGFIEDHYVTIGKGHVANVGPHKPVVTRELPLSSGLIPLSVQAGAS